MTLVIEVKGPETRDMVGDPLVLTCALQKSRA